MFKKLTAKTNLVIGINNVELARLEKAIRADDELSIRIAENSDIINWGIKSTFGRSIKVGMKMMDLEEDRLRVPQIPTEVSFFMTCSDYKDMIDRLAALGETVTIIARPREVIFRATGSICSYDYVCKDSSTPTSSNQSIGRKRNLDDDDEDEDGKRVKTEKSKTKKTTSDDSVIFLSDSDSDSDDSNNDSSSSDDDSDDNASSSPDSDDDDDKNDPKVKSKKPIAKSKAKAKTTKKGEFKISTFMKTIPLSSGTSAEKTSDNNDEDNDEDKNPKFKSVVRNSEMSQTFGSKNLQSLCDSIKLCPTVEFRMYDNNPLAILFHLHAWDDETVYGGYVRHHVAPHEANDIDDSNNATASKTKKTKNDSDNDD